MLPDKNDVGIKGSWRLPSTEEGQAELAVAGCFLGWSSSRSSRHTHDWAWCSACRWSEFRIFSKDCGGYVLHYTGMSEKEGETVRYRHQEARSSYEVVEIMTTRRTRADRRDVFLSAPAARVLSQAAGFDSSIRDAFENRAVL